MEKLVKPRRKPMLFPSFVPSFLLYNHERDQIFFQYSSNPIVDQSFGHVIVFSRDYYFSYLIIILYLILLPGCVLFRQCPFPLSDDRDRIMFQQLA